MRQGQFQHQIKTDEDVVLDFSQKKAVKAAPQTALGTAAQAELQSESRTEAQADVRLAAQTETKPGRTRRVILLQTYLSGCERKLGKAGEELQLERKPDYPEDRWAILVRKKSGELLGLIPFGANQSTARLMDAGKKIGAVVADTLYEACVYMEIPVKEDLPDHE